MIRTLARIENGSVTEQIVVRHGDVEPAEGDWRPVSVEGYDFDRRTHREVGRVHEVHADRVAIRVVTEPIEITADMVRAEAQRRIITLMGAKSLEDCMIKQLNANMRAVELTDLKATMGHLSESDEAEATRLRQIADTIKLLRRKSNDLEAMSPIPADYRSDTYWA